MSKKTMSFSQGPGITHYLSAKGITPRIVHGRPLPIAEPPAIDIVAEAQPVEIPPGRRSG